MTVVQRQERARFPCVEPQDSEALVWGGIEHDRAQRALAGLMLAPAECSREAILELGGDAVEIEAVPYDVNVAWLQARPRPCPGRVLFVGSVGLRKGTHCGACEVWWSLGDTIQPLFREPRYMGAIPRTQVREQFLEADLFVHPSPAEGCAVASLEALACGLAIIATPKAGTVVRDGVEGFIVPERDSEALTDRIQRLVDDRALHERMPRAARERAREMTWDAYGARLVAALRTHLLGRP